MTYQSAKLSVIGKASRLIQNKQPNGGDGGPQNQSLGVVAVALEAGE